MMKITDVHLTLFAWDGIPATQYGRHTGTFSGASQLGLLTIETDDGIRGLRSSARPCAAPTWTGNRSSST